MADTKLVHRRGVLLDAEQRPEGDAGKAPPVRLEVLIAFTRALIREHPGGTRLQLAILGAMREVKATGEEIEALSVAVFSEAQGSHFPKDFF